MSIEESENREQSGEADEEQQKAAGYLASWQRCQADFINYKRRAELEKQESGKAANAGLLLALLPAFDDMERAFAAIPHELEDNSWIDGMKLIYRKLQSALESRGLSAIQCVGEAFDPCVHEAIRRCEGPEGTVVQEMEKGYKFHDRIIRPSKVAVGEGEERNKEG